MIRVKHSSLTCSNAPPQLSTIGHITQASAVPNQPEKFLNMSQNNVVSPWRHKEALPARQALPPPLFFFNDSLRNDLAICFYRLGQESYSSDRTRLSKLTDYTIEFVRDLVRDAPGELTYLRMLFQDDSIYLFKVCTATIKKLVWTTHRHLVEKFLPLMPLEWEKQITKNGTVQIRLPPEKDWESIARFGLG